MITLFDVITVAAFLAVAAAFFLFTDRHPRTLLHLLIAGVAFALANQLGNGGSFVLAVVLIGAGIGYSALVIRY